MVFGRVSDNYLGHENFELLSGFICSSLTMSILRNRSQGSLPWCTF